MESIIKEIINKEIHVNPDKITSLSGGSINKSYRVSHQNKSWFIKLNIKKKYPKMFELEAEGLSLLRSTEFTIPNVIAIGEYLEKVETLQYF